MSWITLHIDGPPASKGSYNVMPNGHLKSASKRLAGWTSDLIFEARKYMRLHKVEPIAGAVFVEIVVLRPRPRDQLIGLVVKPDAPKRPTGTPDLDKVARAVLDGLDEAGVFADDKDDRMVSTLNVERRWGMTHSTTIRVGPDEGA